MMALSDSPQHPSVFSFREWADICRGLDFSDRQKQVVGLLLQGHKIIGVAAALDISPDTVRAHLRRVYPKLGISDRLGLMMCCVREFRRLYPLNTDSPFV
ncbi:MAG: hypothetical protein GWP14_07420 [Actinobacteria bacterium]|nr:hypothetical protein [Actinomycetota bacterium]